MKLIKPSVEYIPQEKDFEGINRQIERCGRICYKSEDKIVDGSSHKFVARMIKSGHNAMLEHGTVYLSIKIDHSSEDYIDFENRYEHNPYSKLVLEGGIAYVTTNYRVIVENKWFNDLLYAVNPAEYHVKRYTMKFTCDRGVSHELVRHRVFSFAQESQRYCNYSKDKFGGVSFIEPSWFNSKDSSSEQREAFIQICQDSEECYLKLLDNWDNKKPDRRFKTGFKGNPLTPQQARCVLPNATKTEIIMTGFEDDWRHFFSLRLRGTTGKPHPDMQYVAQLAWNEFKYKLNLEL